MGISSSGLRVPTPDGLPLHCMVLLVTPSTERDRHLEVLSALARAIGSDRTIQQQLYHVDSPAHAYELLHADEESEEFNYYLEDEL
jgi:mannitol/fructose-specific phosphotransferase system IIA component (Ntr-type)